MPGRKDIAVKQSIPKEKRYTIDQFNKEFPDDDACLEFIKEQRWPDGIAFCEKRQKETKHHRITGRTAYSCDYCGTHIYPLAGTIFEKTTTSLRLWFYAMYQIGSTRCGISAKQIQRETAVTYKTAWRMFKQIRSLMSDGDLQLEGPTVEMDETYFGGRRRAGKRVAGQLSKRGRPASDDPQKTPIVGIVERKGRVVAKATHELSAAKLLGMVREHVIPESTIYTDEYVPY